MEIRKAMRIALGASLAYFHPRRFAGHYRRKRRLSAARTLPNGRAARQPAYLNSDSRSLRQACHAAKCNAGNWRVYRESRFSDAAFLIADGNVYRGDVHNTVKRFNNLRLGIAILSNFALLLHSEMHSFRNSESMNILYSERGKNNFNNEFRPGTIAIAPTRYPFRMIRFHGSQTLSFIPAVIYNRIKRFGFDVRSRPLQSAPRAYFGAVPS